MSSEIKNVILVGAGGNLGSSVLKEFQSSSFNLTVLTRPTSTSTFPPDIRTIQSDYSPTSLRSAFEGQDAIVSLVGSAGLSAQKDLIDAAIAAGVKRFVPSEYGSNTADERVLGLVPAFQGKRKIVEYLISKEKEISWTALCTGLFLDWGLKVGFLANLSAHTATVFDAGDVPFTASTLSRIGRALVAVLQRPAATANRYVYVSSATLTQNQLVAAAEKVAGERFQLDRVRGDEVVRASTEKVQRGDLSGVRGLIQAVAFAEGLGDLGDFRGVGLWDEKLGLEREDLESVVRDVVEGRRP